MDIYIYPNLNQSSERKKLGFHHSSEQPLTPTVYFKIGAWDNYTDDDEDQQYWTQVYSGGAVSTTELFALDPVVVCPANSA
jgi:hypothetical protein